MALPETTVVLKSASAPADKKLASKVAKPAKVKKAGVRKSKISSSHPPYAEMIKDAIVSLKERTGSSQYAITKFIEDKHKSQLSPNFKKLLLVQLKKLVVAGKLVKVKNSFKLSSKPVAAPAKKPAPAKAKAPKPKSAVAKPKAATSRPKPKSVAAKPKAVVKPKVASKPKTVAKPKPKARPVKAAKTSTRTSPGKKVAAVKPIALAGKKAVAKSPKKVKSVKSAGKKAPARKAKK